jgi:hypothetical protein
MVVYVEARAEALKLAVTEREVISHAPLGAGDLEPSGRAVAREIQGGDQMPRRGTRDAERDRRSGQHRRSRTRILREDDAWRCASIRNEQDGRVKRGVAQLAFG